VLPTVSTHGRGRLGMPRHDVSVCNSLSGVSNKKPSRPDESANRIFPAIDFYYEGNSSTFGSPLLG